jgi:hypothetical protein
MYDPWDVVPVAALISNVLQVSTEEANPGFMSLHAQIRAANLSGDCSFFQEFFRGNISSSMVGQHKRCVERRALLSVSRNPYCQDGKAEAAVAEMLPKCLKDTDPFPHVPGLR